MSSTNSRIDYGDLWFYPLVFRYNGIRWTWAYALRFCADCRWFRYAFLHEEKVTYHKRRFWRTPFIFLSLYILIPKYKNIHLPFIFRNLLRFRIMFSF